MFPSEWKRLICLGNMTVISLHTGCQEAQRGDISVIGIFTVKAYAESAEDRVRLLLFNPYFYIMRYKYSYVFYAYQAFEHSSSTSGWIRQGGMKRVEK